MIDDSAIGIGAASSRTRIDTFLVDASLIGRTVGTDNTFRTTVGGRANHVGHAAALGLSRNDLALRIGSAWCRSARIGGYWS